LTDGQVWALAEIAAFALTSLTDQVKEFWPWNTEYYTNHNYPHIVELQNELRQPFVKRRDFDEYIKKVSQYESKRELVEKL
jgi:lipid A disaccharide synthetase